VFVYFTLAKLGYQVEAYKTARFGFEKLQSLKIPDHWADDIEVDALKIRCKPNSDSEGRSMNVSPLATIAGDAALNVGLPPVYNFGSFDSLPMVEFIPTKQVHAKRVLELLKTDPQESSSTKQKAKPKGKQAISEWNNQEQEQVMSFSEHAEEQNDAFTLRLLDLLDH
jgi:intraflagellar transport protein 122